MRIGWDGRALASPRTGIGWYTYHLLEGMAKVGLDEPGDLFLHSDIPESIAFNISQRILPYPRTVHLRGFWEQYWLPWRLNHHRIDLWHSPLAVIPKRYRGPSIGTIHDVAFLLYPHIQPPVYRRYWTSRIQAACRLAARLIAVSHSTRRDLLEHFAVDEEKVVVIHEAADPLYQLPPTEEELQQVNPMIPGKGRFLLFVGTIEPRKNLPFLLRVFKIIENQVPDIHLVIVGGRGWLQDNFQGIQEKAGKRVVWQGYLDRVLLRALYSLSTLVLVPSLYEGFGLQAAEAMACGKTVLASNISSLPEVVADGGILLPLQEEAWVDKILHLLDNPSENDLWGKKAKLVSQQFSWEKAAKETLALYRQVLEI